MKNSIYIGVCRTRDDERFIKSFRDFTDSICRDYSVCIMTVRNEFLLDAQNRIAASFLESDYDYLLLLDDDQWGHTKEMLETLINANTYVSTIKTYSRYYPYACSLYRNIGNNTIIPIETGEGYVECDLTGFPMTLISRETFGLLDKPYFRPYEEGGRTWNSDVDFFKRLAEKGVKPIGCFQHILNHDKVTAENVNQLRYEDRFTGNNIANWKMLKDIENGTFKLREKVC